MKITVYTINDCQFSKAEKEYLVAHNLPYEEKNLESNKEFLTEMLAISNNFAGTPVTKIEKDDGQISVLKGFTKDEFDKITGVSQPQTAVVNSTISAPAQPAPEPKVEPAAPTAPQPAPIAPAPAPTAPQTPPAQKQDDALNSVLNNLQAKAETPAAPSQPPQTPPAPAGSLPNVPEPDFK